MLKAIHDRALDRSLHLPDPFAVKAALSALLHFILLGALAWALSRAAAVRLTPMAHLAPFALALFAAGVAAGRSAAALLAGCVLGSVNGTLDAFNLSLPIGCAVILAGSLGWSLMEPALGRVMAALRRDPMGQARSPNRARAESVRCATLAGLGALVPGLAFAGGQPWPSAQVVLCALAALGAAPFMRSALGVNLTRRFLLPEERTGLYLMGCGAAAGLFRTWPPAALCLSGMAAALCQPEGGRVGLGAGAGMLLMSGDPRYIAALGLCGAAAQLCGNAPRPLRAMALTLSALAASACAGLDPMEMAGLCAAPPLAMLLPKGAGRCLTRWSKGPSDARDPERLAMLLRDQSARRFRAMSAAFGDLAEGYMKPVSLPDAQGLIPTLREGLCDGCSEYESCWAGDSNAGARLLCDLIGMAAQASEGPLFDDGVPADLARRCRRGRLIPEKIGGMLEDFTRTRRDSMKRGGEDRLVSAQFLQAQRLMDALAAAQERPVRLRDRQANRAAGVLERAGIPVGDALLIAGEPAELSLTLREGRWTAALANRAARRLTTAFGRVYAPEGMWGGTLRLVRLPALTADVGMCSAPREAGIPSGDSCVTAMLDGVRLMALICDGMGSGEAAAGESARAAALLGRFLAAGADWSLAVETVNTLLLNTSEGDMFSTVDLMVLDLSTGMAEFVKLAACPALIARGDEVRAIEGGRLPLGILEGVSPAVSRVRLMPGDTVLLASDGVMDAAGQASLEALLKDPGDDMNALAERALNLAQGGERRDDMTAVCLRVRESWGSDDKYMNK